MHFRLKGKNMLDLPSISPFWLPFSPPTPQERKKVRELQCTDLLISSVAASAAASWKPHIHKANKASFFNDSSEYIFAAASLDLLVIMVSSNAF